MMPKKKTKKCRRSGCGKEFEPKTEWQKYCSRKCGYTVKNRRRAKWVRELKKFHDKHAEPVEEGVA